MPRIALSVTVGGISVIGSLSKAKGAAIRPPPLSTSAKSVGAVRHRLGAVAPDIDADEQEQPDHVDEVPVPGGELEAEMLLRREVAGIGADQADQQEDGADQHVEAVEDRK